MLRGLYSVASALEATTRNQEIVSENLAHAVTPGYRRHAMIYDEVNSSSDAPAVPAPNARIAPDRQTFTYFESGPMQQTGNPFDLALVGDGFFVLEGPSGPMYTRSGAFEMTPTGEVRTHGGRYRLQGVTLPPDASRIAVGSDGTISVNGAEVGRVPIATFDRPETLRRVGTTLFQGDGATTPPPGTVRVEQGYREGSNVQAVQEMVSMVLGLRHYEAAEKAMRALSDAIQQNTRVQS